MEDHPNCILDWPYLFKEKSIEELTESLWLTTMELEATRVRVQEEIKSRDDELNHIKHLLNDAIIKRNEARNKYQSLSLLLDKAQIQQPINNGGSDCEESIVSSPPIETPLQLPAEFRCPTKGLPEKGKFLDAVMKAGPLLQNLLLAGPLPHWRHPPPPLDTYQIPSPPLVIPPLHRQFSCGEFTKKRGFSEDSDSSTETKYLKISLN